MSVRRLGPVILLAVAFSVLADEPKTTKLAPANAPGVGANTTWQSQGTTWEGAAFNRKVTIDQAGRTALTGGGTFSLEVVGRGGGNVLLRFFDGTGRHVLEVPGKVHGHEGAPAKEVLRNKPAGAQGTNWYSQEGFRAAGFDAASPFSSKALGDGSVRVELRSSKFPGLFIDGTLPAAHHQKR